MDSQALSKLLKTLIRPTSEPRHPNLYEALGRRVCAGDWVFVHCPPLVNSESDNVAPAYRRSCVAIPGGHDGSIRNDLLNTSSPPSNLSGSSRKDFVETSEKCAVHCWSGNSGAVLEAILLYSCPTCPTDNANSIAICRRHNWDRRIKHCIYWLEHWGNNHSSRNEISVEKTLLKKCKQLIQEFINDHKEPFSNGYDKIDTSYKRLLSS